MALVKVTAANALPTTRQLIADLRKAVVEAGPLPTAESIGRALDALDACCGARHIDVEVLRAEAVGAEGARRVAGWLGPGVAVEHILGETLAPVEVERPGPVSLRVRCRGLGVEPPVAAGTPRPPVLVVIAVAGKLDAAGRAALEGAAQDRPLVFLTGAPIAAVDEIEKRLASRACVCERVPVDELAEDGLGARLTSAPWDARLDLLRAHAALYGLESLTAALSLGLDSQVQETRVRRQIAQQRLARFQQKGPVAASSAPTEFLGQLKARVQRQFAEFERGASERLHELVGYPGGTLSRELDARLNAFSDLELDAKTVTLTTRVPAAFEQEMTTLVRERVGRHMMADVVAMNDLFRLLGQEVERMLADAAGPPVVPRFDFLTEQRARKLLKGYAVVQSSYRGEMPRPGFGEYFAAVRKYAMILVMGASMFGLSSLVRQYREYTVPLTVMLVLFGTASVVISTRTQRMDLVEREAEAARNSLRPELRRILGDIQKQWQTTFSQHLTEQSASVLEQVDGAFKAHQARRDAGVAPERDRLQRQVQSLDALDKRLPVTTKARDALLAALVQVRGDLRQALTAPVAAPAVARASLAAARPAAAAPSAAGVAAAPVAAAPPVETKPSVAQERLAALQAKMAAAREASQAGAEKQDKAEGAALSPARQKLEALKAKLAASKAGAPAAAAAKADDAKAGQGTEKS
jgi:hypothetical protein